MATFVLYGYESRTRAIPENINLAYIFLNNSGLSLLAATYLAVLYSWHIIASKLKLSINLKKELETSRKIIIIETIVYTPVSFGLSFAASFTVYSNSLMGLWAFWICFFIFINGIWSFRKILIIRAELKEMDTNDAKHKSIIQMNRKNIYFGIASVLCLCSSVIFMVVIIIGALSASADPWTFLVWATLFRLLEAIVAWDFFFIVEKYWSKRFQSCRDQSALEDSRFHEMAQPLNQ